MESGYRDSSVENNLKKGTESIQGPPSGDLTRQGKVNHHGPPSFSSVAAPRDSRDLNEELRRKDEVIIRLSSDMQLYMGKIKGYQTLGQLYQESKQECARYKQKNEELANKLDVVMKRLLPDRDAIPVTAIDASRFYDAATSMTFSASDSQYTTPVEKFEILSEKTRLETSKKESPSSLKKLEMPTLTNKGLECIGESAQGRKIGNVESITAEECDEQIVATVQNGDSKSPGESSASSPSFICIGASGLSFMDQTPPLGSMQAEETTVSVGNRPTVVDENPTELRSLNDLLNDPNSSNELRYMAVDLQRIASRASKIEKQARTQQDLLHELQRERATLVQELVAKQQELETFQDRYFRVAEKFRRLELERDPTAANSNSYLGSVSSAEWVEVGKSESNSLQSESMNFNSTVEFRSQIQKLQSRIADLEITNQSLAEGCEHSERVKQNLLAELQNKHQLLQDLRTNDLKRQQEIDEVILASKKRKEELETEKEEASYQQMSERRQRLKAEEQCLTLEDTIAQLKSRIRLLERRPSVTVVEAVRSPPPDSSIKSTEPPFGSPAASARKHSLLTELAILQQQVTIYKEDFDHERKDRELAQSHIDALKLQLKEMKADLDHTQLQVKTVTAELVGARSENSHLKKKFTQALDELKILKGQITPVFPQASSYRPPLYEGVWVCKTCTFENPGIRQTCEMCGKAAPHAGRIHHDPSPTEFWREREYTARGTFVTAPEATSDVSLEEDKSPRLSDRRPPKL